jgi:hypothetical protein
MGNLCLEIQGVPEVLERFCEAKSQEPLGLQKRLGRQKMRLILSLVWKCKNIDYLNFPMSYSRYTKKVFSPFFERLKLLDCSCVR